MARYLVDGSVTLDVGDVEVEIDDNDPRPHREKLDAALHAVLDDRLTLLSLKGARGDGSIGNVQVSVTTWDGRD